MVYINEVILSHYMSTCMWNPSKDISTNEPTKQKQRHREQTYGYQRGKGRGDKLGIRDEQIYLHNYI